MTGINIDITSDTRQFQSQVDDVSDQLAGVAKQLGNVTADGDKAGGSIESAMRTAQTSTAQAGGAFRQMTSTVQQETRKQTEAVEISSTEVNRIQKESVRQGGEAIAQSVSQSVQGFDGTANGAINTISNIGANLAAFSTNPAIAAIATIGVLTFGLIQGAINNADTASKNFQTDVTSLVDDFQKTGVAGKASIGYIVDEMKKLEDGTDATGLNLQTIKKQASDIGVPFKDLVNTYAGGNTYLDAQIDKTKKLIEAQQDYITSINENTTSPSGIPITRDPELDKLNGELSALQSKKDALDKAAQSEKLAAEAGLPDYQRKLNLLTQLDGAYSDAAGDVTDYLNKETGLLDTAAYIKAMQARAKALDDYKTDLAKSGLTGSAKDFLESQGETAAASLLAGYQKATPAQKAALEAIWSTAGESSAGSFTGSFTKSTTGKNTPTVKPKLVVPDVTPLLKELQTQLNAHPLQLNVKGKFGRTTP